MTTQVTSTPIEAVLAKPLSLGWNKVPGISVSGRRVTIHPAEFFFEYTEPQWVLCDWDLVRQKLLGRGETSDATYEQRVADFVHKYGRRVADTASGSTRCSTYPPPRRTAEVPEREP